MPTHQQRRLDAGLRKQRRARIETFTIRTCAKSGDPGCLGWPDGYHDGPCEMYPAKYHRCTECGADDVYAELQHEETCSLSASSVPASQTASEETR